ncbi:MAG: transporter, partial [Micavibrio sp.]|nr:transporter [Micavibrio sp.]
AFGIGTSEFVIMGLLLEVSRDLKVTLFDSGMLITGYALGVVIGAPILSLLGAIWPKKTMLLVMMAIFTLGNLLCALAPTYPILMIARIITSLSHGAFFGIGAVVATGLVSPDKKASAIALMFSGLTIANIMGVPAGTWLGQHFGWRSTFWAVTAIGPVALIALSVFVPKETVRQTLHISSEWQAIKQKQVLLSLLTTTLGFAGVFTIFTYIAPFLTKLSGFSDAAISPLLVLLGVGLIAGNIFGGKLADKNLHRALYLTLAGLAASLLLLAMVGPSPWLTVIALLVFGVAGFATVAPLQLDVLHRADSAPTLASALNIAAFNLGNALGAWSGGLVVDSGVSLQLVPVTGAGLALLGMVVVWMNRKKM